MTPIKPDEEEGPSPEEEITKMLPEIDVLFDRLNMAYNKYFGGAEKKPPILMRDRLDKMMNRVKVLLRQCNSFGISFKVQGVISKNVAMTTMWDKKMMNREKTSGGPKGTSG